MKSSRLLYHMLTSPGITKFTLLLIHRLEYVIFLVGRIQGKKGT